MRKRLQKTQTKAWQKEFIKVQNPILSQYAIEEYKKHGMGFLIIECESCMPYILPGLNIPEIWYSPASTFRKNEPLLELLELMDFKEEYFIGFRTNTRGPKDFMNNYRRNLEILSDEEFETRYPIAYLTNDIFNSDGIQEEFIRGGYIAKDMRTLIKTQTKH